MKHALVFGGSGQIGRPLLGRLLRDGWRVTALSRQLQLERPGLSWLRGDFGALPPLPLQVDAIVSCGPLDSFAQWYAGSRLECDRVVAFGSTSVEVKRGSADPRERDVAQRLRAGEDGVLTTASLRAAHATLLRPTLVYGAGRDATLTRIASLAKRWGRFPLPRNATGRRQPVHVDDLAMAAFAALGSFASHGQVYALPGGETLAYREMVRRVLAALDPQPTLVELPSPLFNLALVVAKLGGGTGLGEAAVQRMRADLVFDDAPARRDLGYAPRAFRPTARMFEPREEPEELP
jgi:nucleoside-diphosphate-sugar epimerase